MKMKDMKPVVLICAGAMALIAFAEKQPIERYQSIIDRQMFGPLPKDFDPTKMPSEVSKSGSAAAEQELTKEQEQLQSSVHFSVINVDHDGKAIVGFTDNSDPKAPKHHYMRVGETQDGWEVKEADPEHATMTVVKDGVEVSLTLGDNSGKGGGKTSASTSKPETAKPGLQGGIAGTLRARRAARLQAQREAEQKKAAEVAEKEAVRQAQAEQEKAEREAERAQQQQQLQALADELRKAREERQQKQAESENGNHETE